MGRVRCGNAWVFHVHEKTWAEGFGRLDKPIENKLSAIGMRGRRRRRNNRKRVLFVDQKIQKARRKDQRRNDNRRRRNEMLVSQRECAYPAGQIIPVELYEKYDYLGHSRESTSRHSADVRKDRPKTFIPNGKMREADPSIE